MGQYDPSLGGQIYLVENIDDVANVEVGNKDKIAFVTQTTLSVDDTDAIIQALKKRFPDIVGPKKDHICYATQNRQDTVKKLAKKCDVLLVIGSSNSSNSNRLCEIAHKNGVEAYLIDGPEYIQESWLNGKAKIGITAGASAPEILVQQVIARLQQASTVIIHEERGQQEHVVFPLPKLFQEAIN